MRPINRAGALLLVLAVICAATTPTPVAAFTPESPEVVEMIEAACGYLERSDWSRVQSADWNAGANALMGMALYKAGRPRAHPKIKEAIETCRKWAGKETHTMYPPALCAIFLLEMDPVLYKKEIDAFLAYIAKRQVPKHGNAWSYDAYTTGDTSQTQYCVLAYWEAHSKGFTLPPNAAANALNWLIRTQDVGGGWGYQGQEPTGGKRTSQSEVRHSIVAAGLGSVYVAADMLGFSNPTGSEDKDPRLPPDVSYVVDEPADGARRGGGGAIPGVNRELLLSSMHDGNKWFGANPKVVVGGEWQMYYLYGLERYMSFRDKVEARKIREPKWYDDGVAFLKKHQSGAGTWREGGIGESSNGDAVSTAFGILFLTRGTMQTIGMVIKTEGELQGTGELPTDGDIVESGGQLVGAKISAGVDDLLNALDSGDKDEIARLAANAATIEFAADETSRAKQSAMLHKLVSNEDPDARIFVVRALATRRDLDNVPPLIYALSDPDYRVVAEAQKGLRFISRKFDDISLPDEPTDEQKRNAQKQWKKWYLSIRPDGVLFD